jgi:hypothetical protein
MSGNFGFVYEMKKLGLSASLVLFFLTQSCGNEKKENAIVKSTTADRPCPSEGPNVWSAYYFFGNLFNAGGGPFWSEKDLGIDNKGLPEANKCFYTPESDPNTLFHAKFNLDQELPRDAVGTAIWGLENEFSTYFETIVSFPNCSGDNLNITVDAYGYADDAYKFYAEGENKKAVVLSEVPYGGTFQLTFSGKCQQKLTIKYVEYGGLANLELRVCKPGFRIDQASKACIAN